MTSLLSYGSYIPYHRLRRSDMQAALGASGGRGSRAVASYDEDVVSMAVEAGSAALRGQRCLPERLYFATSFPPYLDKTNAAVVHAALGLDRATLAVDMAGSPRSVIGALLAASEARVPALAVVADIRTGLPGSSDEREGGDAAAAFLFGRGTSETPELATVLAFASTTEEFLERWRTPGEKASHTWEERFAEHVYRPLAEEAFTTSLKAADLAPGQIDHLVVSGLAARAVRQFAQASGVRPEAVVDNLADRIGNPGAAQPGVLLAAALDRAGAGENVALVHLADGASALLMRTTEHLLSRRSPTGVLGQVDGSHGELSYTAFLTWRGMLDREPPRRPEPDPPAAPPTRRSAGYKLAFQAARCDACGAVNVPPGRVCFACSAADQMSQRSLRDTPATVATFTVDRLAFTPSPPMVAVVVDFDGGGRFRCELADATPADVRIGLRVGLTFRRLLTADGVHNYFWKARPLHEDGTRL
ncbi:MULTISPECIES: OB-fold domain-containing protein [unclassified Frankia]|uniref:OB-fold domain-containing protein n=1 Tax=unclassified Frankia TaxID=2632575 RepID=UPI00202503B5